MQRKGLQQERVSRGVLGTVLGLRPSGALAALLTGAIAFTAGAAWLGLLLLYFVAATAVSRVGLETKALKSGGLLEKSGPRDATQVLANGAAFAGGALMFVLTNEPVWVAFSTGALAASSADTWATELGLLSREVPRSITTAKPVQPGASGGVTLAGTAGGVAGALVVAGAAMLLALEVPLGAPLIGGVTGMLVDSLLGAALQERRWCRACARGTERLIHRCGVASELTGGVPGLRNDAVNALATLSGGAIAVGMLTVLE